MLIKENTGIIIEIPNQKRLVGLINFNFFSFFTNVMA